MQIVALLIALQNLLLFAYVIIALRAEHFRAAVIGYFSLNLVLTFVFFVLSFRFVKWSFAAPDFRAIARDFRSIRRSSIEFWVLNFSATLVTVGQTALVALVAGVAQAGSFSLLQKLFSLLVTLHMAFLSPLAPIYTQKAVLGQWEWVTVKCRRVSFLGTPLFIGVPGLIFCAVHPWILELWSGTLVQDYPVAGFAAGRSGNDRDRK